MQPIGSIFHFDTEYGQYASHNHPMIREPRPAKHASSVAQKLCGFRIELYQLWPDFRPVQCGLCGDVRLSRYVADCMHISFSVCLKLVNFNSGITLASYMMARFSS
jgi:hypothetical protein